MLQILAGLFVALALSPSMASIISTQFHAQDGLGGYSYGHSGGPSSKLEHKTADGRVSGSYSYIDGNGVIQTALYAADPVNGFTVQASNLPVAPNPPPAPLQASISAPVDRPLGVPVIDTPEVAAATAAHLAAVERQKQIVESYTNRRRRSIPFFPYQPVGINYVPTSASADRPLGVPVVDTPEVAAAKAFHFAAVEHQKAILASSPYNIWGNNVNFVYPPFGFSYSSVAHVPVIAYKPVYPYPLASVDTNDIPVPVTDTPEVTAAKNDHLSAVEEAKSNLGVN